MNVKDIYKFLFCSKPLKECDLGGGFLRVHNGCWQMGWE
jgi:hypothetical protein